MEQNFSIKPIKLSDVERMVSSIKKNTETEDVDLSFEFILTAFFPMCWSNIQKAMREQYTQGYIAGTRDASDSTLIEEDVECFCD